MKTYSELDYYNDALILGNGASIAISQSFLYKNLLTQGVNCGFISETINDVFDFFDNTKDFEFVLRQLWITNQVNKCLSIDEKITEASYEEIKEALINTVLKIHPSPSDVTEQTGKIGDFLSRFKKVFSLNYDLLVYWSLLLANDKYGGNLLKDCFYKGVFSDDWTYYEAPMRPLKNSTLVFYPHGNLCLFKQYDYWDAITTERKVILPKSQSDYSDKQLLENIIEKWRRPNISPLFISEGTWKQKLRSIESSAYLSEVYYSILPQAGTAVTIYGWSASEQDIHILKALKRAKVKKIAMSVHIPSTPDVDNYCYQAERRLKKYISPDVTVEFFDAQSENCWIY